jgi:DNA polymerase I-like protein with 3'-5' exonuclease and polymerase domains
MARTKKDRIKDFSIRRGIPAAFKAMRKRIRRRKANQALKTGEVASPHMLVASDGTTMEPAKAFKYWRTGGKNFNFELLYSNTAKNAADRMGWGEEKMMEAVNAHRDRFPGFWQWKGEVANFVSEWGYVQLFDGHRRVRYEATGAFSGAMGMKWRVFNSQEVSWFGSQMVRRVAGRARNQAVNSLIQGGCAALAKRATLRIKQKLAEHAWGHRQARFMFAVHDELVFSIHRSLVSEFIALARSVMRDFSDIYTRVVLDCSPSVGLTFEPWDAKKARLGQIELYEMPGDICAFKEFEGDRIPEDRYGEVVDWLFAEQSALNAS